MEQFRLLLAKRIRAARERLGLTLEQLAKEASLPALQTVSEIELGKREVKAWELVNIARALRVSISSLLATEEPLLPPIVLWRKAPKKDRLSLEDAFLQRCTQYHFLEKLSGARKIRKLPIIEIKPETIDYQDAHGLSSQISNQLNLGARPAKVFAKVLEDEYSVKIWYMDLGEQGSGATVVGDFGAAILINSREAPWRRNFSFAHEVFHIITWNSLPPQQLQDNHDLREKVERIAEVFASNLLLPTDAIREAIELRSKQDKITYLDVVEVAREFDVSTEALIYRLCSLKLIDLERGKQVLSDSHFRALDRGSMPRHWTTAPPIPERFVRLAFVAYKLGRLSRSRLAEFLNTSLIDLPNVLLEYGFNEQEDYEAEIRTT